MGKTGTGKNETEHTVVLPLYEWNLLSILLQYVSEHMTYCNRGAGVQVPLPLWIPAGRCEREEAGVTQKTREWEYLLTVLSRIDEHFARHGNSDFEFVQALPDLALREELMVRFSIYNGSPEDAACDAEVGYSWMQTDTLAWYLARQILVHIPTLKYIVIPMQADELEKKCVASASPMLSSEQALLVQGVLAQVQTASDEDHNALSDIASALHAQSSESEPRDALPLLKGALEDAQENYVVWFLFAEKSGAEGRWAEIYSGPRLDVVDALLSPALHPILLAHGVRRILAPPQVDRLILDVPIAQYVVERDGDASYTIWASLPGEPAYLVGHAELASRWTGRRDPHIWEVWSYVGHGFSLWGAVVWRGHAWHTSLLHTCNTWGTERSFPKNQLAQAIAHVFSNEYQPHIARLHPTLQEKK